MTAPELQKPTHLANAEAVSSSAWLRARVLSLVTAVLGLVSFTIVYLTQADTWATPDWRISVPGFVVTLGVGIAAVVRTTRKVEARSGLWFAVAGVGLAGAAIVLGWFLMIAIILAAMLIAMLILKAVL